MKIAVDRNVYLYVADQDNYRIRKITPTGLLLVQVVKVLLIAMDLQHVLSSTGSTKDSTNCTNAGAISLDTCTVYDCKLILFECALTGYISFGYF